MRPQGCQRLPEASGRPQGAREAQGQGEQGGEGYAVKGVLGSSPHA